MTKLLFVTIFIFILCPLFGAEVELYSGRYIPDSGSSEGFKYSIYYDTKQNRILFKILAETIIITNDKIPVFRNILEKFVEWKTIARTNNVEIIKELPSSPLNLTVISFLTGNVPTNRNISFYIETFNYNNVRYLGGTSFSGLTYFLRITDITKDYFYDVENIINSLSSERIEKAIIEGNKIDNKKKEIDELFR